MSSLTVAVAIHNPNGKSYPKTIVGEQGPKGDTAQIDYDKLATIIHNEVATLPVPKDGVNGKDGKNGSTGKSGARGVQGADGQPGIQGSPGADGKSIELRYNSSKAELEYRYDGDLNWTPLVTVCVLTNTCGP